jgi:hypothetical protein
MPRASLGLMKRIVCDSGVASGGIIANSYRAIHEAPITPVSRR